MIRRISAALLAASLVLCSGLPAQAQAQSPAPGYAGVPIFEMPGLKAQEQALALQARSGDLAGATQATDALISRYDQSWQLRIVQAALAAARQDTDATVTALLEADRLGADSLGTLLAKPPFSALAGDPRLIALTDRPAQPMPGPFPALIANGEALITQANTDWDADTNRVRPRFTFPPILKTHAFADAPPPGPLADLQRLVSRGQAAGNVGDLYDNRDRGHSALRPGKRTQLTHVLYGKAARDAGLDYGLNTGVLFDQPTFGNSSTALQGTLWRSQPRFAMTTPGGAQQLWQLYANNHVYVFPEHRDHDPTHGDVFPAQTPYVLISQGSSGSDRPVLQAVQTILAALRPDTKQRLTGAGLIAPMVQQILRQSLVTDPDAYLTPAAHPTVITKEQINLGRMIALAQNVQPDEIPPMVTLRLLREPPPDRSVFADRLTEVLFDTPSAIARLWRGAQPVREYQLSAEATDPNGRDLAFHWRVVRGNPDRIRIEPLDDTGARVRLLIGWQGPEPVPAALPGQDPILSSRIDIAAFADNGAQISAPAFFSLALPVHENRVYSTTGQPLRITHRTGRDAPYADPLIWPERGWEDRFDYAPDGTLTGWVRTQLSGPEAGSETRFTSHGLAALETDTAGRPVLAREIRYPVSQTAEGGRKVTPTPTGRLFRIDYANAEDRTGKLIPTSE